MTGCKNAVRGTVTVNTCSSGRRSACGLSMHAVRVRILRGGVATGAGHLGRGLVVDQTFYVFVAVDAAQHLAVDRVLDLTLIDVEAYGLAVFVGRERAVAVAGKAVGVLQLLSRGRTGCRGKERKTKRTEQQKSNRSHAYEETLCIRITQ